MFFYTNIIDSLKKPEIVTDECIEHQIFGRLELNGYKVFDIVDQRMMGYSDELIGLISYYNEAILITSDKKFYKKHPYLKILINLHDQKLYVPKVNENFKSRENIEIDYSFENLTQIIKMLKSNKALILDYILNFHVRYGKSLCSEHSCKTK